MPLRRTGDEFEDEGLIYGEDEEELEDGEDSGEGEELEEEDGDEMNDGNDDY